GASLVFLNQRPLSSAFLHQALLLRPIHSNLSGLIVTRLVQEAYASSPSCAHCGREQRMHPLIFMDIQVTTRQAVAKRSKPGVARMSRTSALKFTFFA